jgi:dimethylglycine oxidase
MDPFAAGLGFAVDLAKASFIGRHALVRRQADPCDRRLVCFTLDDPSAVVLGREPILVGGQPIGYVTSSNTGYSVGRQVGLGYLMTQYSEPGQALTVEYFGKSIPATVVREPVFGEVDS